MLMGRFCPHLGDFCIMKQENKEQIIDNTICELLFLTHCTIRNEETEDEVLGQAYIDYFEDPKNDYKKTKKEIEFFFNKEIFKHIENEKHNEPQNQNEAILPNRLIITKYVLTTGINGIVEIKKEVLDIDEIWKNYFKDIRKSYLVSDSRQQKIKDMVLNI